MSFTDEVSLRDRQIANLEKILYLNKEGNADLTLASKNEEIIWKALVLDTKSRAIVSSVLRVNDLLRCGITVHSLINSTRSPLPDVPVIYFIEPTIDNILIIIEDLISDKYDEFYINFTSSINRTILEEFAKKISVTGKSYKIKQVFDQYLDFIVTEPNLFSLDLPNMFTQFNSPNVDEDQIHELVDEIADGLFATMITLNSIPIIRAPQGGPAEFVATQLDVKLREYLTNSRHTSQSVLQRPVLILLDRNIDLASMFSHSWIYQCMVSDVFQLQRNTIKIKKYDEKSSKPITKSYDVDPKDFFWSKYSQLPFPDVVEYADTELNNYTKDAKELTNRTGVSSLNDIDPTSSTNTSHIQQAVEALPELTARKSTLDMHMDILASLLSELQARNLDKFFEIEQNYNNPKTQQEFLELLRTDTTRDTAVDKLRTFLILTLLCQLSDEYINTIKKVFHEKYPQLDLSALNYIQKFKQLTNLSHITLNDNTSSQNAYSNTNSSALLSGLSSKLYGLTEGKISEGLTSIASKIKTFIPDKKQLLVTNIVEAIMNPQNAQTTSVQHTDNYLYFDPKSRGGHSKPPKRQSYSEGVVFIIGGGNYLEYQNLQEWSSQQSQSPKKVIYGGTDIISANEFLKECETLGKN
jgi:hypothetical protein